MRKKVANADKGVTLIAAHTKLEGEISFMDQLYVSGSVKGSVTSETDRAQLVVGEEGIIDGHVSVPHVIVNGTVRGEIVASSKLELGPTARVEGNIRYELIEMQLGAEVDGQLLKNDVASENVHALSEAMDGTAEWVVEK